MKRFSILILLASLLLSGFTRVATGGNQTSRKSSLYAPDQIIVKTRAGVLSDVNPSLVADQILPRRNAGAEALGSSLIDRLFVIKLDEGTQVEDALLEARSNPLVEYAEPDYYLRHTAMPNDSFFDRQWGLFNTGASSGKAGADIGATQAWDFTQGSDNIVVAVIDTGIDLSHADLAPNAWMNPGEVAGNSIDDDGNGFVDDTRGWNFVDKNNDTGPAFDFHGTHVAGTVGASGNNSQGVTGVAWRVKLMALKFISGRAGKTSHAVRAINYAVAQRRAGQNVRVINASWGGEGDSESLREAIAAAGNAGILFVCAAGNGGEDFRGDDNDDLPFFPSQLSDEMSNVISVAALDRSDNLASFSNFGHSTVSLGAPGVEVMSTLPGGNYGQLNGTSMATPHVAGAAVLLWAREPDLTPAQVKERLMMTAVPVLSIASKTASSARANAFNAITN
ncbi:MAG: S8 family peptidase, partial [Acidobacteriota bacterium]